MNWQLSNLSSWQVGATLAPHLHHTCATLAPTRLAGGHLSGRPAGGANIWGLPRGGAEEKGREKGEKGKGKGKEDQKEKRKERKGQQKSALDTQPRRAAHSSGLAAIQSWRVKFTTITSGYLLLLAGWQASERAREPKEAPQRGGPKERAPR